MTDIEKKALEHACQCAGRAAHHFDRMALDLPLRASIVAHARAIEDHEAFRQEVSDAVEAAKRSGIRRAFDQLERFIIAKPDPLLEAINSAPYLASAKETADHIRAAIEARGGRIVWEGE